MASRLRIGEMRAVQAAMSAALRLASQEDMQEDMQQAGDGGETSADDDAAAHSSEQAAAIDATVAGVGTSSEGSSRKRSRCDVVEVGTAQ